MSNFIALPDGTLLNLNGAVLSEFYIQIQLQGEFLTHLFFFSTGTAGSSYASGSK